jgi:VIT1/CCC1 family predicted Fe2+/Mn2+ transporter
VPFTLEEEGHPAHGNWLRDVVFGLNDGLVSNLALVAGVAAAGSPPAIVVLAGVSGLVAGASSMGIGAYISEKSQREFHQSERRREEEEITAYPERERAEVRNIYRAKGLEGELLERVVDRLTADREQWVKVMMEEELNLLENETHPGMDGLVLGGSFALGAVVPLVPFTFLTTTVGLTTALVFSVLALFVVGAGRSRYTRRSPLRGGLEMVLAGGAAAGIAWGLVRLLGLGHVAAGL